MSLFRSKRYAVTCADGETLRMCTDDLEEAGNLLLKTPGAVDVYDQVERRFLVPELEIDVVADFYERWYREQHPWWKRLWWRLRAPR